MTREKEISLGQISDLNVEEEARRPAQSRPRQTPEPEKKKRAAPPRAPAAAPSSSGVWMAATAVLAVLVIVMGAYFFREISAMHAQLDNRFGQSSEQMDKIASQLSATDESLNQSSGKLNQTVANHDSEIRKLWDVSNKRNKEWIKKNEADIDKVEKQRAAMNKSIAALQGDIDALKKQSQQYQMQRNQMQTQLDLASESVRQAEATVAAQKKIVDQVSTMLPQLKSLAAVQGQGDGLSTRLADIEAAIKALDAYRVEVNNRLDRMQGISHP